MIFLSHGSVGPQRRPARPDFAAAGAGPLLDNERYPLRGHHRRRSASRIGEVVPAQGRQDRLQQQRRGALWTCHDRGGPDRRRQPRDEAEPVNPARASGQPDQQRDLVRLAERREQRDLAQLARVLGDPC